MPTAARKKITPRCTSDWTCAVMQHRERSHLVDLEENITGAKPSAKKHHPFQKHLPFHPTANAAIVSSRSRRQRCRERTPTIHVSDGVGHDHMYLALCVVDPSCVLARASSWCRTPSLQDFSWTNGKKEAFRMRICRACHMFKRLARNTITTPCTMTNTKQEEEKDKLEMCVAVPAAGTSPQSPSVPRTSLRARQMTRTMNPEVFWDEV